MDLSSLITMAATFFVIAVAPGPATLGVASVAMAQGRRAGLSFGLGLGLGLLVWGVLAAVGLGAILAASSQVLMWLKLAGGAYLLWLAWKSGWAAATAESASELDLPAGRWIWRGVVLNLSNPKAVFAWLATLSIGLTPDASVLAVALATAICAVIGFAVYLPWVFAFSHRAVMAVYRRLRRWVDGVVAILFAAAGLSLIRQALSRGSAA